MQNNESLLKLLDEILSYLKNSEDALWASESVKKLVLVIEKDKKRLTKGKKINNKKLKRLFAPASSLQETALDNGWGDGFLKLSDEIDILLKKL